MAFALSGWLGGVEYLVGKNRIHGYKTNDLLSAVDDSGYFNDVAAQLYKGDLIVVSGDQDGTPFTTQLTVTSADLATTVTTTDLATATLTFAERVPLVVNIPAIGTGETIYVVCPVAGSVSYVAGVSHTAGAGSGGTSTLTVSVPTTGAIATLAFTQDYVAGTAVVDSTITAHVALEAGGVISIVTDGTGSHTDSATVTLMIEPA